jgi:catechol 2,3-dioxygenase-like lactoylglutathione lyase family enzyme
VCGIRHCQLLHNYHRVVVGLSLLAGYTLAVMLIAGLDHVQINAPAGHMAAARAFFTGFLDLAELQRPEALAAIEGVWFALPDGRQLHIGVANPFVASKKGHVCLFCHDLDAVIAQANARSVAYDIDDRLSVRRLFIHDPWGNRLEVCEGRHASVLKSH